MSASSTKAITNSFVQILLKHAANTPPKIDRTTGDRILSHSKGYAGIGIACFCMALMMFLISLVASPWEELGESLVFSIIMAFFIVAGILVLMVTFISQAIVSEKDLSVKTPWYFRKIKWEEIDKVTYSGASESFVITSINKTKVRVSPGYNGIMCLVDRFDTLARQDVFSKSAIEVINEIKSRANNRPSGLI